MNREIGIKTKEIVDNWLDSLLLKEYSKKVYRSQVEKFYKEFKELTPDNILKYLVEGMTNNKRVYVRKSAIVSYLKYLHANNMIDYNDYKSVIDSVSYKRKQRREVQTLDFERLVYLIDMMKKNHKSIKDKRIIVLLMLCFDTGARIEGILKIRKKDVIQMGNTIQVFIRQKRDKTSLKAITEETYKYLKKLIDKSPYEYIFLDKNKITWEDVRERYYYFWSILKNESRKYLGQGVSFHWIRRGVGLYWYKKLNYDLVAVQQFLDHNSPQTTAIYLQITGEKVKQAMKKEKRPW